MVIKGDPLRQPKDSTAFLEHIAVKGICTKEMVNLRFEHSCEFHWHPWLKWIMSMFLSLTNAIINILFFFFSTLSLVGFFSSHQSQTGNNCHIWVQSWLQGSINSSLSNGFHSSALPYLKSYLACIHSIYLWQLLLPCFSFR